MSRAIERLFHVAHRRGLDVLLEHPGDRLRLAVQTTRARLRRGAPWHRLHHGMPEVTNDHVEQAAGALLHQVEQAPPDTGESR